MSQEMTVVAPSKPVWAWADWAGMTASIGCAIHCAAMPLVFAYLPTLGLDWLADEGFHRYMAVICFFLAMAAFVPGWRKHSSLIPSAWGIAGLALLNYAAFGLEEGCGCCSACADAANCDIATTEGVAAVAGIPVSLLTPFGGLLLVVGHVVNHTKRCGCQNAACCHGTGENVGTSGASAEASPADMARKTR